VAARAALKIVLGRVMGTVPESVDFGYGDNGKPFLSGGGPHFNSSDSGDIVVIAAGAAELGVDVEITRRLPNSDRLADRICTPHELELLADYPEDERDTALLRLWTFKEAALKAVGTGLPGGLRRVEFEFGPGVAPTVKRLREHTSGWTVMTPDVGPGLLCSLVVEGPEPRLISTRLELQSE
jgi:4'-phosphopantetheinyl transferase